MQQSDLSLIRPSVRNSALGSEAELLTPGGREPLGCSWHLAQVSPADLDVPVLGQLSPPQLPPAILSNQASTRHSAVGCCDAQEAARTKGVQLEILKAASENEIDDAFTRLVLQHAGALIIGADPFFASRRQQLVALAARHAVPVMYFWREFAAVGGLISYAPSIADAYRQAGVYAGRILKGAKPADLPVQQPAIFELVVNLNTAKALGLTVPPSILARVDEVIE
jgi:putative tryptophan/tyrosine transport system substrate-binding protein